MPVIIKVENFIPARGDVHFFLQSSEKIVSYPSDVVKTMKKKLNNLSLSSCDHDQSCVFIKKYNQWFR